MMEDTNFIDALKTRYVDLRKTILDTTYIFQYMDSIHSLVNEAQVRHYIKWPILGVVSMGSPEADPQPATYDAAVLQMKTWIAKRLVWLDSHMPGTYNGYNPPNSLTNNQVHIYRVFPNPASDYAFIESEKIIKKIEFYNISGAKVYSQETLAYSVAFDLQNIQKGFYIIKVTFETGETKVSNLIVQ